MPKQILNFFNQGIEGGDLAKQKPTVRITLAMTALEHLYPHSNTLACRRIRETQDTLRTLSTQHGTGQIGEPALREKLERIEKNVRALGHVAAIEQQGAGAESGPVAVFAHQLPISEPRED